MPLPKIIDVCKVDLFTKETELQDRYDAITVARLLRIRDEYQWVLANPDLADRLFVDEFTGRYGLSDGAIYADLGIIKQLLPALSSSSRDFHRWKANQMLLETYAMAKKRKDTKTMERAASSYAKYNRVDLEDEQVMPYDQIVIQPFTATNDPSVLGITPIPDIDKRIKEMTEKYRRETLDIEDVQYEEADLEENELFGPDSDETNESHIL